jgi:hypothetical protein
MESCLLTPSTNKPQSSSVTAIEPVAEIIDSRHLPFIFASGYGAAGLPKKFRDRPMLQKPLVIQRLGEAIEAALG